LAPGHCSRNSTAKADLSRGDEERALTLLSVAYGHEVPRAVIGALRRVARHWQGGDKSLAAIHLAQMGLPDIGEDAAYRLSLAAELVDAGVAPRECRLPKRGKSFY
jgi:hypothetical protein